jgi:hypothetical protein
MKIVMTSVETHMVITISKPLWFKIGQNCNKYVPMLGSHIPSNFIDESVCQGCGNLLPRSAPAWRSGC